MQRYRRISSFLIVLIGFSFISCNPLLNFGSIVPDKFFRSGQPDKDDLKAILPKGIKTIINLKKSVEGFEMRLAARYGVALEHIKMSADRPPTDSQLETYFGLLDNPNNYPIWMHCQGGADRTGVMTAIYRLEYQNWSKVDAIKEMIRYFHIPPAHPRLTKYIRHYQRQRRTYVETPEELEVLDAIIEQAEKEYLKSLE